VFDALLHARSLRPRDLADLAFFGVEGGLVPSDDAIPASTAAAVRRGWDEVALAVRRLRRARLAAWGALGVHPRRVPLRGLEALLVDLPAALGRPEIAALGAVGLDQGGELEERVLARQLELARELRLPVVAATPWRGKERITRRLLALLREAELEPARVLVTGADARTVRAIRACGHLAGLSLSGEGLERALALVGALGPEGLVLGTDAGLAGGDLLALARAADRLGRAGLSEAVVRRVCGGNALAFLRRGPGARGGGAAPR
jgi:predicted metal-dependent TIM-barrel fold hydrolase